MNGIVVGNFWCEQSYEGQPLCNEPSPKFAIRKLTGFRITGVMMIGDEPSPLIDNRPMEIWVLWAPRQCDPQWACIGMNGQEQALTFVRNFADNALKNLTEGMWNAES